MLHGCIVKGSSTTSDGQRFGALIRPSHRSWLFSSQEYSIISQSGRSVSVRVTFQGLREGLGILDDHFVVDVAQVGLREALHQVQLIAVRMPHRIEAGPAIEVDGVDHQRVALPVAD